MSTRCRLVTIRCTLLLAATLLSVANAAALDQPARPAQAAIASANGQATDAGMEILAAGGNAFDAAVAVSAMLGLVEPESSGLGGGGFMLLHLAADDRQVFIDARERAPLAATRDMYLDDEGNPVRHRSVSGALAAAIPGLPAGLEHLAKRYGRLPLARSLQPAISKAREGWIFSSKNAAMMGWRRFELAGNEAAAALFLKDGSPPVPGDLLKNPDYADLLERIASEGSNAFYRGEFAERLVKGVRDGGGIWSLDDLSNYQVVEREPLAFDYHGYRIVTAPPPSSGGIALATAFNQLAGYPWADLDHLQRTHLLTESMRRAYRDRAIYLGDPDFTDIPTGLLTSPEYAAGLRAGIHPRRATPSDLLPGIGDQSERSSTSHFSIVDVDGNLVAVTQTVNLPYGSAFVVPGSGFLLNNEMDDFSVKPGVPNAFGLVGEDANAIEPGKRPLSSMSPSLLFGPERVAAIGTPGGSRIISMVLLGLLELIDGATADEVVALPRIHHQYLPDALSAEPGALSEEEIAALTAMGHTVSAGERTWGNMQLVVWNRATGAVEAGTDPRQKGVGKASLSADESIFQ